MFTRAVNNALACLHTCQFSKEPKRVDTRETRIKFKAKKINRSRVVIPMVYPVSWKKRGRAKKTRSMPPILVPSRPAHPRSTGFLVFQDEGAKRETAEKRWRNTLWIKNILSRSLRKRTFHAPPAAMNEEKCLFSNANFYVTRSGTGTLS